MPDINVDPQEIRKFSSIASEWWDENGPFKTLHDINGVRLSFIQDRIECEGLAILDIGCGGGLVTEALAKLKASVIGIDMDAQAIQIAKAHQEESKLTLTYQQSTAEAMAEEHPEAYDVVSCLEMLEHVPDPTAIIAATAKLVKPGGHIFFSTINRHPKAYLMAIAGAEYLLRLLPKGTHDYTKFIRPSELDAAARVAGLQLESTAGIQYNPFSRKAKLTSSLDVNYIAYYRKL